MIFRNSIERLKRQWASIGNLSRVPRFRSRALKIFLPSLFITGLLLMIPEYYQQVSAERVFDGIAIPDTNEDLDICLNFSTQAGLSEENQYYIKIPYRIKNLGYVKIADIVMEVKLRLEFEDKDGEGEEKEIFSKKKTLGSVRAGEEVKAKFDYDYTDSGFDTENIYYFMYNCKDPDDEDDTKVFLDIIITFSLESHSDYKILYKDIDLTDDTETPQESGTVETSTPYRAGIGIDLPNMLIFTALMGSIMLFLHFRRRSEKSEKSNNSEKSKKLKLTSGRKFNIKQFFTKHKSLFISLFYLFMFTLIPIFLYFNSLYTQKTTIVEDVTTGDYTARFEMATWLSVIILCIIYVMTLLPSIKPKVFARNSVKRGLNSLGISILVLVSVLIWATYTSIIAYEIEGKGSATVIVDTAPSFVPYIVLSIIYVVIRAIDLPILILYKNEFSILRSEKKHEIRKKYKEKIERAKKMKKDADELNEIIFNAIQELGEKASFNQIKKHFKERQIPKTSRTGERLNLNYLQSLINQFFISKGKKDIFCLEHDGKKFLEERKRQREQERQKAMEREIGHQLAKEDMQFKECANCHVLNEINEKWCYNCQKEL